MPEGYTPPTPPPIRRVPIQEEVKAALKTEPLIIRTMQDDVREARLRSSTGSERPEGLEGRQASASAKASAGQAGGQAKGGTSPQARQEPTAPTPRPPVPLPPKIAPSPTKVVMKPRAARRGPSGLIVTLVVLLLIVLAGSGGLAWRFVMQKSDTTPTAAAPLNEVLPATSATVVQYNVVNGEDRGALLSAWNAARAEQPSVAGLLTGDPRLLLLEAEVQTFSYVLLEDEVRPYLLVPKTPRTAELLAASPDARVAEVSGWYVLNSVATDSYTTALAGGALPASAVAVDASSPLHLWLGPGALSSIRENSLGADLAIGRLQELSLAGRLGTDGRSFTLQGQGRTLEPLPGAGAAVADHHSLSHIPAEATFAHLGANFAADLKQWGPLAEGLDMTVLQRSNIAPLLEQLTGPYALYTVASNPTKRDLGVIIELPALAAAAISTPNATVEEALQTLLPLITGRAGLAGAAGAIEFNPNTHAGIPLAYANFSQPSQALDYAVLDNHLLITTSRESMFSLLETMTTTHGAVEAAPAWQALLTFWGAMPAATSLELGQLAVPHLTPLLPSNGQQTPLYGLAATATTDLPTVTASGILVVPPTP